MTGQFITNTEAQGCFIVFQSDNGPPDQFRILLRPGSELTMSSRITLPLPRYSVHVYDLEKDGLPNEVPAVYDMSVTSNSSGELYVLY